jgi:hypothetical protein
MAAFSDYLKKKILNHVLGASTFEKPEALFIALSDAQKELSGNAYVRVPVKFKLDAGAMSNSAAVVFPVASPGGWGQVMEFSIFDAKTGGNRLVSGTLATSKLIGTGDRLEFGVGALVVTLD